MPIEERKQQGIDDFSWFSTILRVIVCLIILMQGGCYSNFCYVFLARPKLGMVRLHIEASHTFMTPWAKHGLLLCWKLMGIARIHDVVLYYGFVLVVWI